MSEQTTTTTTENKVKTTPLILEKVVAAQVEDETGKVHLNPDVAPALTVEALLRHISQLNTKLNEKPEQQVDTSTSDT